MAITPKHMPMPERLANLKPPTREDAINRVALLRRQSGVPMSFADSKIMRRAQESPSLYPAQYIAEERRKFDDDFEMAVKDSTLTLTRLYEADLASRQHIEMNNAAVFQKEKDELRAAYLSQPGATDADFERALPGLLEAKRQQAVLNAGAEFERMKAEMGRRMGI